MPRLMKKSKLSQPRIYGPNGTNASMKGKKQDKTADDNGQDDARSCLSFLLHIEVQVQLVHSPPNLLLTSLQQSKDCSQKPDQAQFERALADASVCQNKEEGILADMSFVACLLLNDGYWAINWHFLTYRQHTYICTLDVLRRLTFQRFTSGSDAEVP